MPQARCIPLIVENVSVEARFRQLLEAKNKLKKMEKKKRRRRKKKTVSRWNYSGKQNAC